MRGIAELRPLRALGLAAIGATSITRATNAASKDPRDPLIDLGRMPARERTDPERRWQVAARD